MTDEEKAEIITDFLIKAGKMCKSYQNGEYGCHECQVYKNNRYAPICFDEPLLDFDHLKDEITPYGCKVYSKDILKGDVSAIIEAIK